MSNKLLLAIVLLTGFIVFQGCKHKNNDPTPAPVNNNNNGGGNTQNPPPDTGICFTRDILPIFISNCAKSGCHDAATKEEGFEFTSYETITKKDFEPGDPDDCELYEKITEDKPSKIMPPPPNPALSSTQISLIRRWIEQGALNTTNCSSPCDTGNFTYSGAIKPLVTKYCLGCHSSASPSNGIALDNYNGIKVVAQNGKLLGALKRQPGFVAMPQGGTNFPIAK